MRWAISTRRVHGVAAVVGLALTGLATSAPATPKVPPQGAIPDLGANGWVKVLDENFNGSSVDENLWYMPDRPVGSTGYRTRDAIQVANGNLTIRTFSEDRDGNGTPEHLTGDLTTSIENPIDSDGDRRPGFEGTYGYVEARVRLDTPHGLRSAFWLLPATAAIDSPLGDPGAGGPEIDIFEIDNPQDGDSEPADGACDWQLHPLPCDRIAGGSLHWNGYEENQSTLRREVPWNGASPQAHFLTYGLLWTPDGYRMYRDGVEVFHSTEAIAYSPQHLLFTNYIDPATVPAGGYGPRSSAPPSVTIDYVHVWQRAISAIPDQSVGSNSALAVPFSVTDHFASGGSSSVRTPPAAVWVTAESDNQAVLPTGHLLVTGNPALAMPAGSLTNSGFESGSNSWSLADNARIWSTRKRGGTSSLRVEQAGGRAEQTVSGLQPNTTYVVSGWYNLELCFDDTNNDGRVTWNADANGDGSPQTEEMEPLSGWACGTGNDGNAHFDWGVKDVDSARSGDQAVVATHSRNAWQEAKNGWWAPRNDRWANSTVTFTTGPTTTQVVLFVDNLPYKAASDSDSDLSFDDVTVRPIVPPNRTVALRPRDGASGTATVTLTALDATKPADQRVLGTETFTVRVSDRSSFTNGNIEELPAGAGWDLHGGSTVILEDSFTRDRAVQLARSGSDTAIQRVTGLTAGRQYQLTVRAKLAPSPIPGNPNDVAIGLNNATGDPAPITGTIAESTPGQAATIRFTPTGTAANLVVLDWTPGDGSSIVDDVTLAPVQTAAAPSYTAPGLSTAELRLESDAPRAIPFTLPAGTTITRVTSSNPELFPSRNIGAAMFEEPAYNGRGVLALAPVPDRTGKATVTVTTSAGTFAIPVVVSDAALSNPDFESRPTAWTFGGQSGSAAVVTGGERRSGSSSLRLEGSATATQTLTGLDFNTPFLLAGWAKGGAVKVTVETVPDARMAPPEAYTSTFEALWLGGGTWTESRIGLSTTQCNGPQLGCQAGGAHHAIVDGQLQLAPGGQVKVTLADAAPNDGQPVHVDDLQLVQAPRLDPLREIALVEGQTAFRWNTRTNFNVGRVPANAIWDDQQWEITSSDQTVLPLRNVRLIRSQTFWEHYWSIETRADPNALLNKTGRAELSFTLGDPAHPGSVERSAAVTISAGDFNNGSFTQGANGWRCGWCFSEQGWQVTDAQAARQAAPVDKDQVLRISSGVVAYRVTGLQPNTRYALSASAVGNGSSLRVVAPNAQRCTGAGAETNAPCHWYWGTQRGGSLALSSTQWTMTPNLVFQTQAESEVWIFVQDDQLDSGADDPPCSGGTTPCDNDGAAEAIPARRSPCIDDDGAGPADSLDGETCIDEIGLFLASDVGV